MENIIEQMSTFNGHPTEIINVMINHFLNKNDKQDLGERKKIYICEFSSCFKTSKHTHYNLPVEINQNTTTLHIENFEEVFEKHTKGSVQLNILQLRKQLYKYIYMLVCHYT